MSFNFEFHTEKMWHMHWVIRVLVTVVQMYVVQLSSPYITVFSGADGPLFDSSILLNSLQESIWPSPFWWMLQVWWWLAVLNCIQHHSIPRHSSVQHLRPDLHSVVYMWWGCGWSWVTGSTLFICGQYFGMFHFERKKHSTATNIMFRHSWERDSTMHGMSYQVFQKLFAASSPFSGSKWEIIQK